MSISLIPQVSVTLTDFGYHMLKPFGMLPPKDFKIILLYNLSTMKAPDEANKIMKSTFAIVVNSSVFLFDHYSINLLFQLYLRK